MMTIQLTNILTPKKNDEKNYFRKQTKDLTIKVQQNQEAMQEGK